MAKSIVQEFTKGLWEQIPPFRLVLGLCPTLAMTNSVENAIGMGLATTFVLVGSNFLVSAVRNVIPNQIRIACFIIVIATFVTVVELLMQAYTYGLFLKLGLFIPLIVVNCIVLGRAEAFAFKNSVVPSIADGAGIGVGFTLALTALGTVRELFGANSITIWSGNDWQFGISNIFGSSFQPFTFMIEAPGAFICLGLMLCLMNLFEK